MWLLVQSSLDQYMPHGMCYLWQDDLVLLHVISDAVTTLAYFAIPPFLIYFAYRVRKEVPAEISFSPRGDDYDWSLMFLAFGVFIVACGATHAMGIWTIWEPRYWLEGGIKAVTGLASIATAIALPPLVPRALEMVRQAGQSERRRVELEQIRDEQEELVRRLEAANEAKSRFFAGVSHDLRTPLSLVLGPMEELLDEDLPEEHHEKVRMALRNAETLEGQVEDLLAVARMEGRALEADSRTVDLAATVRESIENYVLHARSRDIDLERNLPNELMADVDGALVRRALHNLLSNAFKFVPDGGRVRCSLQVTDGSVEMVVEDSGPGIPEEEQERVFERFEQSSDRDERSKGGAGLGLAIVREVAEAHDGSVGVGRGEDGGARLTLRLPLAATAEPDPERAEGHGEDGPRPAGERPTEEERGGPPPEAGSPEHPARSDLRMGPTDEAGGGAAAATVLVVEDDADMARYLGRVLSESYEVVFAEDGRDGLERAEVLGPDLVLTDVMMPRMDGAELTVALRQHHELSDVPILVLTAMADEDLPEKVLRAGAQDHVLKPVRPGELKARIANLLELTGSRRLLQEALSSDEPSVEELARRAARRQSELERAVEEKQVLLRELHHRVKGNLQTITSLLRMQIRSVTEEGTRRALDETRGRVAAMGLLHERLYESGVPERVELSRYLRNVITNLLRSHGGDDLSTELTLEEAEVGIDDAIPCGLVVHELMRNALRHAFPDRQSGTIRVYLRRDDDRVTLGVADDGQGIDTGGRDGDVGLGLDLVESLADQLGGRLRVTEGNGIRAEVIFPSGERGTGDTGDPSGNAGP